MNKIIRRKIDYKCEKCGATYETETALRNHVCEPPLPQKPKNRMLSYSVGQYFQG
jgi:hypothetical protein